MRARIKKKNKKARIETRNRESKERSEECEMYYCKQLKKVKNEEKRNARKQGRTECKNRKLKDEI